MFFWDGTIVLLIPAMLLAMWAQAKVKSAYAKYSQVGVRSGVTGADVARRILQESAIPVERGMSLGGAEAVGIEAIGGQMTDHYDPRSRTVRLSQDVYHGRSIAALGIAAHEVGHAIQHAHGYAPMQLRSVVYPVSSLGSTLAWPLFIGGFFLYEPLLQAGIILFSAAVAFTVITLPVEFNASRRAVKALAAGGYLTDDELYGVKKVLSAAAMTYVAATAMAAMQLLRMILLARRR